MAPGFRRAVLAPVVSLFLISLGGLLLHLRVHPPGLTALNSIPAVFGTLTAFVVPPLFLIRRTVPWGYLLTVASVLVGTVGMAWWAAANWTLPVTLKTLAMDSTLPDIAILAAKWPLAHHILSRSRLSSGPPRGEAA